MLDPLITEIVAENLRLPEFDPNAEARSDPRRVAGKFHPLAGIVLQPWLIFSSKVAEDQQRCDAKGPVENPGVALHTWWGDDHEQP
ncbi:hypothetical protein O7626_00750 [Micromonospora sp. WMMD1102]|uniref:hypothetical protein n=1 Tax=Micromonospora sp. WMMD1102 TaxID=3016105 RepID=UPI0024150B46|nr:hypothetical protein [Micromonospora sp. WMMD1102]MDG4784476.1 hypothetical protein [Micromonospora sp. WMMD1102]